jgi:hypothetical protein
MEPDQGPATEALKLVGSDKDRRSSTTIAEVKR